MALQENDVTTNDVEPSASSLDRLHDITMPEAVSWWPLAFGWYVLFAVIAISLVFFAVILWRNRRASAYRRAAQQQLALARSPAEVSEVLRQTALVIATRETVAAQRGELWPRWLADQISENLEPRIRIQLTEGIYRETETSQELNELKQFAARWIKTHR